MCGTASAGAIWGSAGHAAVANRYVGSQQVLVVLDSWARLDQLS